MNDHPICPYLTRMRELKFPATFLGLRAAQAWDDLLIWEVFFNRHTDVRGVVELGTGNGGMALFLALECAQRGIQFATLDNQRWVDGNAGLPAMLGFNSLFRHADLWNEGGEWLRGILADDGWHPLVLYCDDGDKRREWRTFGPLLRPGDYIAVHDWGQEFGGEDIGEVRVSPVLLRWARRLQSMTRWFRREA